MNHKNNIHHKLKTIFQLLVFITLVFSFSSAADNSLSTTPDGFIVDWLRLGPISYGEQAGSPMQGHPIDYTQIAKNGLIDPTLKEYIKNESMIMPKAGKKSGELVWEEFHNIEVRINMDESNQKDYILDYLVTYLYSPRTIKGGAIYVGSDDFVEIMVNGKCVHVYKTERRGLFPADEVKGVDFNEGWNVIRVKTVDVSYGYEFIMCLADENGTPMGNYKLSLDPPKNVQMVSAAEAESSRKAAHEKGQEKVSEKKAEFSAFEAIGYNYPLKITYEHNAEFVPVPFRQEPLAYINAGSKEDHFITFKIATDNEETKASYKIKAYLVQRDKRQPDAAKITDDLILDTQEIKHDFSKGELEGKKFKIPAAEIGFFSLVVEVYSGKDRVKLDEHPVAVISPEDYQPPKMTKKLNSSQADWQKGDFNYYQEQINNQEEQKLMKFWPIVSVDTAEIASPKMPNQFEIPGARHIGVGHIAPIQDRSPSKILYNKKSWIEDNRTYIFQADDEEHKMEYSKSKASPAVWVSTTYSELNLFQGLDRVGLGQPAYAAYETEGSVEIQQLSDGQYMDLTAMTKPWILFWFAGTGNWNSIDIPVLVVLQHKPKQFTRSASGINIQYVESAGAVSVMPLYGTRIIRPADTKKWTKKLPADIIKDCELFSQMLQFYPTSAKDYTRISDKDVMVRIDYQFLETKDDWQTPGKKCAPLPYWLGLAIDHPDSVINIKEMVVKTKHLHPYGPLYLIADSDSLTYTLKDMLKYVSEVRVVKNVKQNEEMDRLYKDLAYVAGHRNRYFTLSYMSDLGGKDPNYKKYENSSFTAHRILLQFNGGYKFGQHIFENENALIANLSHAINYIPADKRQNIKALMMRFEEIGTMLDRYTAFNEKRLMFEDTVWFMSRFMAGIWSYAHYTGHWQLIRDRWPLIKTEFRSLTKAVNWDQLMSCGSEESNLLYQAMIAYARMAMVVEDYPEYVYAASVAARQLAIQQSLWMTIDNKGYQNETFFKNYNAVKIDNADAGFKRPAKFYWWYMTSPVFDAKDGNASWHAGVLSPFTYPYFPEIIRFQTEKNTDLVNYYLKEWQENFPQWYTSDKGRWHGVYFGPSEFFAVRAWASDFFKETESSLLEKYMQWYWGVKTPQKGSYEFNNRGWASLPIALTAIIESSGDPEWVQYY